MRNANSVLGPGCVGWVAVWSAFGSVANVAPPTTPIRLARSDDGLRFVDLGAVVFPAGDLPDLELGPDGDLLALARIEPPGGPNRSPVWATTRSENGGETWSAPRAIFVIGAPGQAIELQDADLLRTPGGAHRILGVPIAVSTRSERETQHVEAEGVRVLMGESKDGVSFQVRRRPVAVLDGSVSPRLTSAVFSGQIHLYVESGGSTSRRRSGEHRLEHRVSRDGRRFVSLTPSKIPGDVTMGSIVETREGVRMYASDGEGIRSFISKNGREWREERGVRLTNARSPAVVRLRGGTYLMAYVSTKEQPTQPVPETTATSAGDSANRRRGVPNDDQATPAVLPELPESATEKREPQDSPEASVNSVDSEEEPKDVPVAIVGSGAGAAERAPAEGHADGASVVLAETNDNEDDDSADDAGFVPRPDREPDIDYVEWYRSQTAPDGEDNAAGDYEEIANDPRLKAPEEGEPPVFQDMFNSGYEGPPIPWDAAEHPEWAESGKRVQDLLEKFQRASLRSSYAPRLRFDENDHPDRKQLLMDIILPDLSAHRTLVKATLADAWKKVDGRVPPDRMINVWRTVLRGANHFEKRATLIENLVSLAERRLVFENARWALKHEVLSLPEELREALDVLNSLGRDHYDPTLAARGEFAMAAQLTQYLFSPAGPDGQPRLNPRHVDELAPAFENWFDANGADARERLSAMTVKDYYVTLDAFDLFYREVAEQLRVGYPDVRTEDVEATTQRYLQASALTEVLMPNLSRVLVLRARNEANYRATQLVYAVQLFHSERGQWPKTLDELPRIATAEMRIDPFTGKDFGYRLEAPGPVIYSFSENAEDDGGVHSPRWGDGEKIENASDDFVFWPVQGSP